MAVPPERRLIAHLLRRAGFGASPEEIDDYARLGFRGAVDRLVFYESVPNGHVEARVAAMEQELDLTKLPSVQQIWMYRILNTARPLQEKMTLFWHDHFATANSKVGKPIAMYQQSKLFRDKALGNLQAILQGVSRDPAMIRWLDGNTNRKGKPNENYARELMELFTMGVGNYSEIDVREAARAFTGWNLNRDFQFVFNARQHDEGRKTFLGSVGNWNGDDIIRIILARPVTAEFIARKLFSFFVHDHPAQSTVRDLAEAFRNSGYEVRDLVRAILLHPEFASDEAFHGVVKSPVEYVIGMMKALGIREFLPAGLGALNRMGMTLFNPPSVAGWDWGAAWIGTNTLLERLNVANALVTQRDKSSDKGLDPVALRGRLQARTPEELVEGMLDLLVDGDVSPEIRDVLVQYAYAGYDGEPTRFFQNQQRLDRTVRGLGHLVMSTPVYQMA